MGIKISSFKLILLFELAVSPSRIWTAVNRESSAKGKAYYHALTRTTTALFDAFEENASFAGKHNLSERKTRLIFLESLSCKNLGYA